MTMLAASGIYLILDTNSPRPGESLNRHEPWTTYTEEYLNHAFKVIEAFAYYNNTLGFFAGNEVINDDRSAYNSPRYLKAVVRDVKMYIHENCPRKIPIGYSAADDLRYRISLARYLECGDKFSSVDFYGVNSYQWCGAQSFDSSGYNILVSDYADVSFPMLLSEYGCNLVTPRLFQEVDPLYSSKMTPVFSGGLVYEFSQESNNYGLVEYDKKGNAYLLDDFETFKAKLDAVNQAVDSSEPLPPAPPERPVPCLPEYQNLYTPQHLPSSFGTSMIANGVLLQASRGHYIPIGQNTTTTYRIFDTKDREIVEKQLVFSNLYAVLHSEDNTPSTPSARNKNIASKSIKSFTAPPFPLPSTGSTREPQLYNLGNSASHTARTTWASAILLIPLMWFLWVTLF